MKKELMRIVPIFIFSVWLLSCIASDDVSVEPDEGTKVEVLKRAIIGKWEFQTENLRIMGGKSWIELRGDSSYTLNSMASKKVITDKYTVVSSSEIALSSFGKIANFKDNGNEITFDLYSNDKRIASAANRVAAIDTTEQTALLCRNWNMLSEEAGIDSVRNVGKSTVQFYQTGIYVIKSGAGTTAGSSYGGLVMHWKWHPEIANRIIYWYTADRIDPSKYYYDIHELTESSLKITESNYFGLFKFNFEPE
ncbi:hypothetical protein DYBT9275_03125 [Dyadobacter sp. CECT 9275]|uniref:Uncharacterized protein n=1 Tax=Dyadobacter helix TaxID=2822344 RepID=A0A916JCQ3_9BACT|nr:hypothetical protein [Dyadobacter sp. CECT 9275]CAG5003312.1 hypothetical protein DYBT9275_03125 [Dyadobacter sp. CECT 9275]